jgi:hypothetical protein
VPEGAEPFDCRQDEIRTFFRPGKRSEILPTAKLKKRMANLWIGFMPKLVLQETDDDRQKRTNYSGSANVADLTEWL